MRKNAGRVRRPSQAPVVRLLACILAGLASSLPLVAFSQEPPNDARGAQTGETTAAPDQLDVRDIIRALRHKQLTPAEEKADRDWRRTMVTLAPFIASKPSTGLVAGAAASIAFFRGEPASTHISSASASATFSSKGQVLLSAKMHAFGRDDRRSFIGDNRFQWTSEDTYGLGTSAPSSAIVNVKYDYVRLYDTAYWRLRPALFAGAGLHVGLHRGTGPAEGQETSWDTSPYVVYSQAHGLPLDSQTSSGVGVALLVDSRDNAINPARGWYAQASYRAFMEDFLGGDSTWQELYLDARTYYRPATRHTLAFWFRGDLVTGGTAPYFDLPATGMDTFGRSGRGYVEGRFRGERLLYGEVEYRVTLMANGLLGAVAFLNTTTITNLQAGEKLFDSFATGAGFGLRVLMDKRSRTNLCLDLGWGKNGSHGVYLAIQEAF